MPLTDIFRALMGINLLKYLTPKIRLKVLDVQENIFVPGSAIISIDCLAGSRLRTRD